MDINTHNEAVRWAAVVVGAVLVLVAFFWSLRVLMVQETDPPPMARLIFRGVRDGLLVANRVTTARIGRLLWQFYVPLSLLAIIVATVIQTLVGFILMFWGVAEDTWLNSYQNSYSSMSTLGVAGIPGTALQSNLSLLESFTTPVLIALLITCFITIYGRFDDRKTRLRQMDVQLGHASNGPMLLEHTAQEHQGDLSSLDRIWIDWDAEFRRIDDLYKTVEGYLVIFAPGLRNHWARSAMSVLDAANLRNTVLDLPTDRRAERCLRSGVHAITETTEHYKHHLLHHEKQHADVSRNDFDDAVQALAAAGLPVAQDRDRAWTQFDSNRRLYEDPVVKLCDMVYAHVSSWSDPPNVDQGHRFKIELFGRD